MKCFHIATSSAPKAAASVRLRVQTLGPLITSLAEASSACFLAEARTISRAAKRYTANSAAPVAPLMLNIAIISSLLSVVSQKYESIKSGKV